MSLALPQKVEGQWKLIIGPAIERSTGITLSEPTPLLEEGRHVLGAAFSPNAHYPIPEHRSGMPTTLTTHNHPVNALQIKRA